MISVVEKLYDTLDEKRKAYQRHMKYFLTHDMVSALSVGVAAAKEERYDTEDNIDPEIDINAVKTALMGPLAGLGD